MASFVTGRSYKDYVLRMRKDGCYGTHVEIQAMSELYCRPIEIYQPQAASEPITPLNIFQSTTASSSAPIRLLYLLHNHYEALIDPQHPSVGVGLGVNGLSEAPKVSVEQANVDIVMKESEREQLDQALMQSVMDKTTAESEREQLDQALMQSVMDKSAESEREQLDRALMQSVMDKTADAQQLQQAIQDSESDQLEKEMEQQAIQQSLVDYMVQLASQIVIPQFKPS